MVERVKTEFGANKESDKILGRLPRGPKGLNATVWVDAAGRLCIAVEQDGLLVINERDLYKVYGDELYEV